MKLKKKVKQEPIIEEEPSEEAFEEYDYPHDEE